MTQILSSRIGNSVKLTMGKVSVYRIPTDLAESDGTLEWNSTTLILVELRAADKRGLGYTYAHEATAGVIDHLLKGEILGRDLMETGSLYQGMIRSIRNNGNAGIAFMAISAIDVALWDLKSRILDIPLVSLLGQISDHFPVYGSGGFTSYTPDQLKQQLGSWAEQGFNHVKMKVGRHPESDVKRVHDARKAIGDHTGLFLDANGAYSIKQALGKSFEFSEFNVNWFEEPVSSDNLNGLHLIRQQSPPGMNIAAGEYGYHLPYFNHILTAEAVDILQADATRCGGITGFIKAAHLSEARDILFSSHCAPAIHIQPAMSLSNFFIGEYFCICIVSIFNS